MKSFTLILAGLNKRHVNTDTTEIYVGIHREAEGLCRWTFIGFQCFQGY